MTADLAAVLTGSLLVVELQLFGRAAVVVPDRLRLLSRGLVQQLWTLKRKAISTRSAEARSGMFGQQLSPQSCWHQGETGRTLRGGPPGS